MLIWLTNAQKLECKKYKKKLRKLKRST